MPTGCDTAPMPESFGHRFNAAEQAACHINLSAPSTRRRAEDAVVLQEGQNVTARPPLSLLNHVRIARLRCHVGASAGAAPCSFGCAEGTVVLEERQASSFGGCVNFCLRLGLSLCFGISQGCFGIACNYCAIALCLDVLLEAQLVPMQGWLRNRYSDTQEELVGQTTKLRPERHDDNLEHLMSSVSEYRNLGEHIGHLLQMERRNHCFERRSSDMKVGWGRT
mmetsp:Transcript_1438/g.3419  ORF Transcript_1438/g.3419 Transcript_1438/m.3419 type:complete len:223 (+) Transcript_1438:246-914(+)